MQANPSFGRRLALLRGWRGLTQEELARRVGCHSGYIARIERDITKEPGGNTLAQIADTLGISLDQLMGRAPVTLELAGQLTEQAPA
jgi:transcriptional regulator with XRE-family HTH domain